MRWKTVGSTIPSLDSSLSPTTESNNGNGHANFINNQGNVGNRVSFGGVWCKEFFLIFGGMQHISLLNDLYRLL